MTRRPPRSTLFPTRRSSDLTVEVAPDDGEGGPPVGDADGTPLLLDRLEPPHQAPPFLQVDGHLGPVQDVLKLLVIPARSEEHTSELQSRPHLVCRLLLEKKK